MVNPAPFDLPFDEAINFFQQKGFTLSPNSWRDVWEDAHARAFTVARVTSMDILKDIRTSVQEALDKGTSLGDFKKNLGPLLQSKGWFAPQGEKAEIELPDGTIRKRLQPWRLETIYRTNLQSSYAVGHYEQMMETADRKPYWQYMATLDSVTRPAHRAMHKKVYRFDDPVWQKWFPPNGFNCRCYVKSLSAEQVQERGLNVDTGLPGVEPDEGWRYNVGETGLGDWQPDWKNYPQPLVVDTPMVPPGPKPLVVEHLGDVVKIIKEKLGEFSNHGITEIIFTSDNDAFGSTDSRGRISVNKCVFPGANRFHPSKDLLWAFKKLGTEEKLTFNEEYALEVLWHEINHNRQLWRARPPKGDIRTTVMETVTQWFSRRTYNEMMDTLGGFNPIHQAEIKAKGYGYSLWVNRFDRILGKLGMDEAKALDAIRGLHGSVDRYTYTEHLVEFLYAEKVAQNPGGFYQFLKRDIRAAIEGIGLIKDLDFQQLLSKL